MDVSKVKLDVALTDNDGTLLESVEIPNTEAALKKQLTKWIRSFDMDKEQCLLCLEPTGHYSDQAVKTLVHMQVPAWLAVPLDIKRSMGLTRGKSDRIDAVRIAAYARRNHDKAILITAAAVEAIELKQLLAFRARLVEDQRRHQIYKSDVNTHLPEEYRKQLDAYTKNRLKEIKAAKQQVERAIEEFILARPALRKLYALLLSIAGIGPVLAAYLLACTHGFTRFRNPRQLACHGGTAPHPYTSGTSINGRSRVSHHADKTLKTLLHMSVLGMLNYPNDLHEYYQRRTKDGKHNLLVLNNMKRKLIDRICAVINRGTPYTNEPPIRSLALV